MKKYVFGVDVGGTTVKMGLFNVDVEVLDKWEIKTRIENGGEAILPDIAESAKAKFDESALTMGSAVYAYTAMRWLEEHN